MRGIKVDLSKSIDMEEIEANDSSKAFGFIPFTVAFKRLAGKIDATIHEIAAWVCLGKENGGLAAFEYTSASSPSKFYFYKGHSKSDDYIHRLMVSWFLSSDIESFEPLDRYLSGGALIERWSKLGEIEPQAYIRAKVTELQLNVMHPQFNSLVWFHAQLDYFPPLTTGLFSLAEIRKVEAKDFDVREYIDSNNRTIKQKGHFNHDPVLQSRANEIVKNWPKKGRRPTKSEVAKVLLAEPSAELKIDLASLIRRLRKDW